MGSEMCIRDSNKGNIQLKSQMGETLSYNSDSECSNASTQDDPTEEQVSPRAVLEYGALLYQHTNFVNCFSYA